MVLSKAYGLEKKENETIMAFDLSSSRRRNWLQQQPVGRPGVRLTSVRRGGGKIIHEANTNPGQVAAMM